MKIRKGRMSDAKEIYRQVCETPELHALEEENVYTLDWVKSFLKSKSLLVLVAEDNKQIIGFIMAELWEKQGYSFLSNLSIKPEYQRKGIGSKLYDEYEARCRKMKLKAINYLVVSNNEKMHSWSEKHGFKKGKMLCYYEKKL
jgi:ribosomal protein S18 acetylase RimI-like enzyme